MKKIIVTFICACLCAVTQAQEAEEVQNTQTSGVFSYQQEVGTFDFGPRIGFVTSILSLDNTIYGDNDIRVSVIGGVFTRYQVSERFSLQGDLVYVQKGANLNEAGTIGAPFATLDELFLNTIDLPITAIYNVRYKLFGVKSHFDVFGGVNFSYLVDENVTFTNIDPAFNETVQAIAVAQEENLGDFGFGIVLGSGLTFGRVILSATTKIGLTDYSQNAAFSIRSISTEWTAAFKI